MTSGFKNGALETFSSNVLIDIKHIETIIIKTIVFQMDIDIIFFFK